jgi:DNA invertase Pin-like site-specific DNA recombinase
MQLRELREYCKHRDWEIVGEYVDTGWSGMKIGRPALKRIMEAAHTRQIDCVMVWKLDRWGRNMMHAIETIQDLAAHGVRWLSITQGLDTHQTNPMSKAMLGMMAVFAEFEREMTRERVMCGLRAARARGATFGRPRKIVSLKRAEEMRAGGLSIRKIAKRLQTDKTTLWRRLHASAKP